jgi:hypothetical protein
MGPFWDYGRGSYEEDSRGKVKSPKRVVVLIRTLTYEILASLRDYSMRLHFVPLAAFGQ